MRASVARQATAGHYRRRGCGRPAAATEEFPTGARLSLDDAGRLLVRPDLSRWSDGRCTFVGELKYRYDTGEGDTPNLYQTLAYATAAGLPDAMLIYADGPSAGTTHQLPHAGFRIHVRHLDLAAPLDDLREQIRSRADHIETLTPGQASPARA
ncbi:MAG TPA: hypothetical protein VGD67_21105 [Pseudonocardiaceae bacterium]